MCAILFFSLFINFDFFVSHDYVENNEIDNMNMLRANFRMFKCISDDIEFRVPIWNWINKK